MAEKTETEAKRDMACAATVNSAMSREGSFVALPTGFEIASLEELQENPNRTRLNHVFRDTRSLAHYADLFFDPEQSLAISYPADRKIVLFIDHDTPDIARHRDHQATFEAIFTAEYAAWRGLSSRLIDQKSAGEFLEDRAADVVEPDAAAIMDMVMTFDALKKVTFRQSTRLHDGQRQFTYQEENEARGNVTLPEQITLLLQVFDGQDPQRIKVRVRYRIDDGSLKFGFNIADMQALEDEAFRKCEDALETDTKVSIGPILRALA